MHLSRACPGLRAGVSVAGHVRRAELLLFGTISAPDKRTVRISKDHFVKASSLAG